MIESLAPWIAAFLLTLVGGAAGWSQIRKHGALSGKLKRTKEERDAARDDDEIAALPPLTSSESVGVLRRLRARISGRD
jgi:hypothetical protein